jgi:pyruvate-ferredoxin/flavodoxin oxidoreductase
MSTRRVTLDGNEAVASVAYRASDVIAIYPITPSTAMGEHADAWAAKRRPNLWGAVPLVVEMQSEGGAAGALHGALQTGALATTFTASQGLLLMLPNMYKIAGELTPAVFHVAARSVASQALSIFGDHSDVMAARATGWAMLAAHTVQAAQDLALIAHAATLEARVPILHFFDGFRTSHEINTITPLDDDVLRAMISDELVQAHRDRALSPDHPVIRGTAQNPDVFFQARERSNPFYNACPDVVQAAMDRFAALTGRQYRLFEYVGAPDAERVIVVMGSGAETAEETARVLTERGEKVGVVNVHLFRPFSARHLLAALPPTVRAIAVLDRTKEPGSAGEPLYLDLLAALHERLACENQEPRTENQSRNSSRFSVLGSPMVVGGRYGLSSKEFTPAMVRAIFDELRADAPKPHFTIGIEDDITNTSLRYDRGWSIEADDTVRCVFWGLGSDGTVGANKNAVVIIGEETTHHAQGYFVLDSKKSGSVTTSHLRFGPRPIHAPYLIERANFVACHQFGLLERVAVLEQAMPGAVFLLNSPYGPADVWEHLPPHIRQTIVERGLRFIVIDGTRVARETGMGGRINTVMQTCFFAISGVLPRDEAIAQIKDSIRKTYGKRGETVVQQNFRAVDQTLDNLHEVVVAPTPGVETARRAVSTAAATFVDGAATMPTGNGRPISPLPPVPDEAPEFVRAVLGPIIAGRGDTLPVSALPADGTFPTGTSRWEKRNIALEIPFWEPDICIQCGKCALVCPHAVIRTKVYPPELLAGAPEGFRSADARYKEAPGMRYTLQVAPEDCTACGLCIEACPVKDKRQAGRKAINMVEQPPIRAREKQNWEFFLGLPDPDRTQFALGAIKNAQLMIPLFEFSGACAGCGETPYIKLVTQLFGDRTVIANATGCSSIYGGNLPTTPYTVDAAGRGPAWANSLFEDNAEFGLGMRLTLDTHAERAHGLVRELAEQIGPALADALLAADQTTESGIASQRARVAELRQVLGSQFSVLSSDGSDELNTQNSKLKTPAARELFGLADALVYKSVWIIGGDGWAYDIGYGGLDHVLASGRNVNILVLDTEVYSNTGGQASKATPAAAVAKFAARGKAAAKKDLGLMAMAYGNVYVAQVAMGGDDVQTLRAFLEAEAYGGPSLIIAYSHCIAHGIDMRKGLEQQKLAVQSGAWPLYRYNPALADAGKSPLTLDSKAPSVPLEQYLYNETRFGMLRQSDEGRAEELLERARRDVGRRWRLYQQLAATHAEG